jgi:hypothetical protein
MSSVQLGNQVADQGFICGLPIWFVVIEEATAIGSNGKRELDLPDDIDPAEAFCGGIEEVVVFTDKDMVERHAKAMSPSDCPWVPFEVGNMQSAIDVLNGFYRQRFTKVIIDPMARDYPGTGPAAWTNRTVSIPEFIASLRSPLPPDQRWHSTFQECAARQDFTVTHHDPTAEQAKAEAAPAGKTLY